MASLGHRSQLVTKLLASLGSPLDPRVPRLSASEIDELFPIAFENRVALLLLERCDEAGLEMSADGAHNLTALRERKAKTEEVVVKLGRCLNEIAPDGWVLFKSLRPFPATPNDTDWFPLDRREHGRLCAHLLKNGFEFLERAPLQLTLVESAGLGVTHSDKRGGIYYVDCYVAPGADYFVYLDPAKMKRHIVHRQLGGIRIPMLNAAAELGAIMFHNVFPEKTYSLETFLVTLIYLKQLQEQGSVEEFVDIVRSNSWDYAASANLAVTASLHKHYFGTSPSVVEMLMERLPHAAHEAQAFEAAAYRLPYNFSARSFWGSFFRKLKDPVAARSAMVQAAHMLNPVFFLDVVRIIWRRMRPGGVYKQM
jgi:hypothetical protein